MAALPTARNSYKKPRAKLLVVLPRTSFFSSRGITFFGTILKSKILAKIKNASQQARVKNGRRGRRNERSRASIGWSAACPASSACLRATASSAAVCATPAVPTTPAPPPQTRFLDAYMMCVRVRVCGGACASRRRQTIQVERGLPRTPAPA